jgi:hypothetical protein
MRRQFTTAAVVLVIASREALAALARLTPNRSVVDDRVELAVE